MCQLGETTRMPSLDEDRWKKDVDRGILDERHATPPGGLYRVCAHSRSSFLSKLSVYAAGWRQHHLDVNIIDPSGLWCRFVAADCDGDWFQIVIVPPEVCSIWLDLICSRLWWWFVFVVVVGGFRVLWISCFESSPLPHEPKLLHEQHINIV